MLDGLNNAQNSNLKYCVIYNAPYSFLRKIAMQIKQIDNVLTITLRDLVNAIPLFAIKKGLLTVEKANKKNIFNGKIMEIEGLPN